MRTTAGIHYPIDMSPQRIRSTRPPSHRPRWRATLAFALAGAGVIAWVAVPTMLYVLLTTKQASTPIAEPTDVWVGVDPNETPTRRDITVKMTWSAGEEIFAPNWTGLIETVDVAVGDVLTSGQPVAIIGGIQRIAVHTDRPFVRPLTTGDRGGDVTALHEFLATKDLPHGDGDRFSEATRDGVNRLARTLGVPGSGDVARFEPDWFLYLPSSEVTIKETALRPGAPAPTSGDAVIVGEERIVATLLLAGTPEPTTAGTDGEDRTAPADRRVTAEDDEELLVAGQAWPLSAERDAVDPASFPALNAVVDNASTTISAILLRPPASGQWTIPTAAVAASSDGNTCVIVRSEGGAEVTPIAVEVVGQGAGVTVVVGDLASNSIVLVAPSARKHTCS